MSYVYFPGGPLCRAWPYQFRHPFKVPGVERPLLECAECQVKMYWGRCEKFALSFNNMDIYFRYITFPLESSRPVLYLYTYILWDWLSTFSLQYTWMSWMSLDSSPYSMYLQSLFLLTYGTYGSFDNSWFYRWGYSRSSLGFALIFVKGITLWRHTWPW